MAQRCIFLDRDGTIIVEKHYLGDPDGVEIERDVPEALSLLAEAGFIFVVLSNQSGVGRGLITLDQVKAVNARVDQLLAASNIKIAGWYYCPHHPDEPCDCRKPLTGMVDQALQHIDIDLHNSFMVGDKDVDVLLGRNAQMDGRLVLTGHGKKHADWCLANGFKVHETLLDFAKAISPSEQ